MENATDALFMAFAVLAFVIALSVSIYAFSEVSIASQSIINNIDKEVSYNYIEPEDTKANRTVTREDIIATLYRIYNENYAVQFEGLGEAHLFRINTEVFSNQYEFKNTNTLNFDDIGIGSSDKEKLLNAILINDKNTLKNYGYWISYLPNVGLYDIIGTDTFEEYIGIYYLNDNGSDDDVNKTEKRIITYKKTTP